MVADIYGELMKRTACGAQSQANRFARSTEKLTPVINGLPRKPTTPTLAAIMRALQLLDETTV
jgi:hypothetical protein